MTIDDASRDGDGSSEDLARELFDRCRGVEQLESAQIEGFVSGLFAAWDSDADAFAFIERCEAVPGPVSATVCAALAQLDRGEVGRSARRVADRSATALPATARSFGTARPGQAWQVRAPFGHSIVVGFATGVEGVDHAVLAELDEGLLVDLQLTGAPDELLDADALGDGSVEVSPIEVGAAVDRIVVAWQAAHETVDPTPGMLANQRFAQLRFRDLIGDELPLFRPGVVDVDLSRGMSPAEIAEADRAALSTLRAALGDVVEGTIEPAWQDIVRVSVPGLSAREREALLWLEWADWLGVGIGLARGLDRGEPLSGEVFVDLVNRCPEVSSTIHGDDREYAAWAFDIAIDHLRDTGAVIDDALTDAARHSVHPSLVATWAS